MYVITMERQRVLLPAGVLLLCEVDWAGIYIHFGSEGDVAVFGVGVESDEA